MVGLSEKAKGKQRAVEQNEQPQEPAVSPQRVITVRFADGLPDLEVTVEAKDTVRKLKQQKIRESRPQTAKRRLRLIYSGQILTDSVILIEWLDSFEKRQKRVAVASDRKGKSKTGEDCEAGNAGTGSQSEDPIPTWVHCSVGAEMAEDEQEGDDDVQKSQIRPLRGFDRLAAAGFTEEDIASFRRTFHSGSAAEYLDSEPPVDDEDYEEHARALEDRWIESLDGGDEPAISPSSASTTLLQGLLVGFFFPLLPLFFLHEARPAVFWENGRSQQPPDSVVFSKRMQMAIVLGFIINITFGIWRMVLGN